MAGGQGGHGREATDEIGRRAGRRSAARPRCAAAPCPPRHGPLTSGALAASRSMELRARLIVEGFLAGLHRSPFKGFSVEFAEHREYSPGDEIRHIDWKAYGRTDRLAVKRFEQETNLRQTVVLDSNTRRCRRQGTTSSCTRHLRSTSPTSLTMARVCRALDGMPLAIELAAARLRTMSLDQLADRLDDIFRLLTGGSRTALPRQRTLRAVIDWSWELLSDAERTVLRRLSVFSGGASLEAAERVCAGPRSSRWQVLELLTALTEKSLIVDRRRQVPDARHDQGVRRPAARRGRRIDPARHAHLAYFTDLAETAEPYLRRTEQVEWLATLAADHDNLSAAMRGAIAAGEAQSAMRLAAAAGLYWWLSGNKAEGNELVMAATRTPGEVTDEIKAMVYVIVVTFLNSGPGDEHHAEEWIHEAYRISQRPSSPTGPGS